MGVEQLIHGSAELPNLGIGIGGEDVSFMIYDRLRKKLLTAENQTGIGDDSLL